MLQLKNIVKTYVTGDLEQNVLKGVSLNFRDNEFVSILGHSGSGKTTMLNIIGGLDRYTSGDLIINGVSTKKYKDADWDIYRNNKIGFVFQSYNLIPHQTVLANVEMALTLSGVGTKERRKRAEAILKKVGLGDHIYKKPNQMSGGQMQRVAIARALVNNPDILLADEPTGALDSDTSIQIMELLKEIAKDKLVIMVTHNPELAEQYSNRIVRLKDGKIISDTNPFTECDAPAEPKKQKKISMSFLTALSLSFNNLKTKKGRTLFTSFAGSIGIIGVALILALSTGMNAYIASIQKDTMSSYPITINSQDIDLSSLTGLGGDPSSGESNGDRNETVDENSRISYTDYVAMTTSSLTTIINGISYVLIAFVAVSLIVSCIMIGIITHISVMERTKEIGILRVLGASKSNISQVFNAETFIIGCCSGLVGIGISLLALIPINLIISNLSGIANLSAQLPVASALILIVISIVITMLGGLLPAKNAAKIDPVIALRSE